MLVSTMERLTRAVKCTIFMYSLTTVECVHNDGKLTSQAGSRISGHSSSYPSSLSSFPHS